MPTVLGDRPDDPNLASILEAGALQTCIREGCDSSPMYLLLIILRERYPDLREESYQWFASAVTAAGEAGTAILDAVSGPPVAVSDLPIVKGAMPRIEQPARIGISATIQFIDPQSGEVFYHAVDLYSVDIGTPTDIMSQWQTSFKHRFESVPGGQSPEWIDPANFPNTLTIGAWRDY